MSKLFSPFRLGPLALKNRIVIPPMDQYSATEGKASDWHRIHYGVLAGSGAALLILEATAVSPEGRISPSDLGLWSDEAEEALRGLIGTLRAHGSAALGVQLAHAGRKASVLPPWQGDGSVPEAAGGWPVVAPSPLPWDGGFPVPRALSETELERVRSDFVRAARRAVDLGFDLIEIHSAHGYLLHQFLSPLSNARPDRWGGTLEGRMAFPLSVFEAVRQEVPESVALGVRVSATDWVPGGWDVEQCAAYARELEARGCRFIHVSSGGLSPRQEIPLYPGYQIPLAAAIRSSCSMPVIGVGLITDPDLAEHVVASGQADLVAVGRGMLFNPHWPWLAAARLGARVAAPNQYLRAAPHGVSIFETGR